MAKIDTFTKILLVVIAIFIGMIALKPIFSTEVAQANPGQFNNLDLEIQGSEAVFFDRSTGTIWVYNFNGTYAVKLQLKTLGEPMKIN
ncbi:MAG: hypothetical protein Q6358_13970 [Candidatus Brocadiales bacterium]|nr:hypothetical protein [Candidatus Brocadiales bacterium]